MGGTSCRALTRTDRSAYDVGADARGRVRGACLTGTGPDGEALAGAQADDIVDDAEDLVAAMPASSGARWRSADEERRSCAKKCPSTAAEARFRCTRPGVRR